MCNYIYSGYAQHLQVSGNLQKLICSKLPKMLTSPITIDGKPTSHMENPTYIRKMLLIAPLTVLV